MIQHQNADAMAPLKRALARTMASAFDDELRQPSPSRSKASARKM